MFICLGMHHSSYLRQTFKFWTCLRYVRNNYYLLGLIIPVTMCLWFQEALLPSVSIYNTSCIRTVELQIHIYHMLRPSHSKHNPQLWKYAEKKFQSKYCLFNCLYVIWARKGNSKHRKHRMFVAYDIIILFSFKRLTHSVTSIFISRLGKFFT